MMKTHNYQTWMSRSLGGLLLFSVALLASCNDDDPEKVNEEEVITDVVLLLTPTNGQSVTLAFSDPDGENGSQAPTIEVSGPLAANTTYDAVIALTNATTNPETDITEEIVEEADEHLFCYTPSNLNLTITAEDEDIQGRPIGLLTQWVTGAAGTGTVKVVLRHQPNGLKTGTCPGGGETDIEVDFNVTIQ